MVTIDSLERPRLVGGRFCGDFFEGADARKGCKDVRNAGSNKARDQVSVSADDCEDVIKEQKI